MGKGWVQGQGEEDDTHILLEVAQAPPVLPPSCPHPGPSLNLGKETHCPQTQGSSAISKDHTSVRGPKKGSPGIFPERQEPARITPATLMTASTFALKYCSRSKYIFFCLYPRQ